jgi:hypothetical protein
MLSIHSVASYGLPFHDHSARPGAITNSERTQLFHFIIATLEIPKSLEPLNFVLKRKLKDIDETIASIACPSCQRRTG